MKYCVLYFLLCITVFAQSNHYVLDGGSGDGSAWNNALDDLPATLTRGDTYYIGDGSYSGYTFNDAVSGTDVITIKKAIESDHGTETGWSSAYGDGVAQFGIFNITTSYWDIDGQVGGGPDDWDGSVTAHGFKIVPISPPETLIRLCSIGTGVPAVSNINIRHINMEHLGNARGVADDIIYSLGSPNDPGSSDVLIEYCYLHDCNRMPLNTWMISDWTFQYNYVARNNSTPAIHSEAWQAYGGDDVTVRWNLFEDIEGTAFIAFKKGSTAPFDLPHNRWNIYGNVMYNTSGYAGAVGEGIIAATTNGTSETNDILVYNNSFIGISGVRAGIQFNYGTGCEVVNNIFYDCHNVRNVRVIGDATYTVDFNLYVNCTYKSGWDPDANDDTSLPSSDDPFTDFANHDFSLDNGATSAASAINLGGILAVAYNTDWDGIIRGADGSWDRGVLELVVANIPVLTSPTFSLTTETTVTLGANLTVLNGTVSSKGTVWGTSPNPTGNYAEADGTQNQTGVYTDARTGLSAGTVYFARGKATNENGDGWSEDTTFGTEPDTQPASLTPSSVTESTMTLSWTEAVGAHTGVIVLAHEGSAVDANPVDGTTYTANTIFGSGDQIGTGNRVMYIGALETVDLTGFMDTTTYHFAIRTYAGSGTGINYNTTDAALTGSQATGTPSVIPTLSTPSFVLGTITTTTATFGATITDDGGATITARGTYWNTTGDPVTENQLAEGGTAVGAFTDDITGLAEATQVYFRGYATNSEGDGVSSSDYFFTEPATQPSSLVFSNVAETSMTVAFDVGSAANHLLVMRAGSAVTEDPIDGVLYSADTLYGNGQEVPDVLSGNYSVYQGGSVSINVTNLVGSTTYHVAVYSYSGSGDKLNFQQDSPLTGNQATASVTGYLIGSQ